MVDRRAADLWVKVSCNPAHTIYFEKRQGMSVGDDIWCRKCQRQVTISGFIPPEDIRIFRCSTHNCRRSRNCGTAELMARRYATRHAQLHPTHVVEVIDGNGKVYQTSHFAAPPTELPF